MSYALTTRGVLSMSVLFCYELTQKCAILSSRSHASLYKAADTAADRHVCA